MSTLDEFVKNNAKFLKLGDGEVFEGKYISCKIGTNQFNPDQDMVIYKLQYKDGKEVTFQTGSLKLARAMSKIPEGSNIRLKRIGVGIETKYLVKIIGEEIPEPQEVIAKEGE